MHTNFVLFHKNCTDGLGSKYAAWKHFGDNAIYIPVQYNEPFPDIPINKQTNLYITDFSYSREILVGLKTAVKTLMVLDHHDTAQKELEGLDFAKFDMEKSGATLTWEYFHPDKPIPTMLTLIEDYDLFRFAHPDSLALSFAIKSHIRELSQMPEFDNAAMVSENLEYLIAQGKPLAKDVESKLYAFSRSDSEKVRIINLDGQRVAVYNTGDLISLIGQAVNRPESHGVDYSISYFLTNDGKVILSFRSRKGSDVHVGEIAKRYGGGGHPNAAGAALGFEVGMTFLKNVFTLPDLRNLESDKLTSGNFCSS